ncbi:DUF1273 family protein [Pseudoflavonifractor sp. 60]|uniref:SLOG family protein n=1 Tax=Pseudoflavonifractor sp. 60 TaxID=2304576 RepID=UPI001368A709|nr:SLOG family protein [Pseudoflavonifractor sp. 60]NBI65999.1 DUF1273 family protein [Pseudoflavonifractor sp. 60]
MEQYLTRRITDGINYLYSNNVRTFLTGGAIGFDALAAKAVLKCRESRSDIRLIVVMPCQDQTKGWGQSDIDAHELINRLADGAICPSERYYSGCMHQRNRILVDNSSTCICYLTQTEGGTAYTVNYARVKGLSVFNLAKGKKHSIISKTHL